MDLNSNIFYIFSEFFIESSVIYDSNKMVPAFFLCFALQGFH